MISHPHGGTADPHANPSLWPDEPHLWQRPFYNFSVWSERKRIERPRYMHRNPLKRGLLLEPEQWQRCSDRSYTITNKDG